MGVRTWASVLADCGFEALELGFKVLISEHFLVRYSKLSPQPENISPSNKLEGSGFKLTPMRSQPSSAQKAVAHGCARHACHMEGGNGQNADPTTASYCWWMKSFIMHDQEHTAR